WLCESQMADVLFHEIGHHIHHTARPEYREPEDVADAWMVRLRQNYYDGRHRWWRILFRFFLLKRLIDRLHGKSLSWGFAKGYVSHAEYEQWLRPGKNLEELSRGEAT